MMKTKKVRVLAVVLVLVSLLGAGATLAYFTDSEEVTNVITMGKVDVELTEPNYDPDDDDNTVEDVIPNQKIVKDPTITVKEGSQECYVRAKVKITGLDDLKDKDGKAYADMLLANINIDSAKWYLGEDGYYYYNSSLKEKESTQLFTEVVIPEKWGNEVVDKKIEIIVSAEAIQKDNFEPTMEGDMITKWLYEDGTEITAESYEVKMESQQ